MKSSFVLSSLFCASISFAQTPSTSPANAQPATTQSPSPAAASAIKPRGPDAVAHVEPNRVVALINGKQVTAREAASLLKAIPPDQLKRYESNLPSVVQQIYMSQDLAQQAVKMSLDQQSPLKEQLQLSHDGILAQAYINKIASNAAGTPTADPAQYYNAHPQEFDRVDLSGIFVGFNPPGTPASSNTNTRTEEQARAKADEVEKKLKAGGDFTTLARTDSDNQQSATHGGKLGPFSVDDARLPADLKTIVQKLQPGQVSEPVRIPNAYLIVKVDSRNKETLDQARPEIVKKLEQERNQAAVKHELDKYTIQVQDPDFFNSSAAAANTPTLQKPGSPALPTGVPAHKP
jgi:hypothetical protein